MGIPKTYRKRSFKIHFFGAAPARPESGDGAARRGFVLFGYAPDMRRPLIRGPGGGQGGRLPTALFLLSKFLEVGAPPDPKAEISLMFVFS